MTGSLQGRDERQVCLSVFMSVCAPVSLYVYVCAYVQVCIRKGEGRGVWDATSLAKVAVFLSVVFHSLQLSVGR